MYFKSDVVRVLNVLRAADRAQVSLAILLNLLTFHVLNFSSAKGSSLDDALGHSNRMRTAMQSAVIAYRGILSVRLSVTFRYCVQTNEDTIMWFSASGMTIFLVSEEVTLIRIFAGDHPSEGVKVRHSHVNSENLTNNMP